MNAQSSIGELAEIQSLLPALVEDADGNTLREQYHPDLSPLGWHLGHCVLEADKRHIFAGLRLS